MAWVCCKKNGDELIFSHKPIRVEHDDIFSIDEKIYRWECSNDNGYYINIPKGSIKKLIGRELSWSDVPMELKDSV